MGTFSPADQTVTPGPASQRKIPLLMRKDLVTQAMTFQGIPYIVVKDPLALNYHRLRPEEAHALQLLDGSRTLDEVRLNLQYAFPELAWSMRQVQDLLIDLHQKNLLRSLRPDQDVAALRRRRQKRWEKLKQTAKNFLFLRLPGWDPEATLSAIYPFVKWMFTPAFLVAALAMWAWSLMLILMEWQTFQERLPDFQQFFAWPNLLYVYAILAFAKIIHEFGHGLSCKHYGGECHSMGVMLLVFSPCLYCDVSDSWMLKNKWQRILIGGAGMIIEIILSSIALFLWWNTRPGLFHHLCFNLWLVTSVSTVVFNLNPLMRFDGYFMFSDWREIPNLREKADKLLRDSFSKWCLGIDPPPDPLRPTRGVGWFIAYAIAAWCYRWIVLFGITWFLYQVLKPYGLEFIGLFMGASAIGGMIFTFARSIYKIVTAPRTEPIDRQKPIAALLLVGIVVLCICLIPLPHYVEADFSVQPDQRRTVEVLTEGQLLKVHVLPGDRVAEGDLLVELRNEQLEDRLREVERELDLEREKLRLADENRDAQQLLLSEEHISSLELQHSDLSDRVAKLQIRAPVAGMIIGPEDRPVDRSADTGQTLPMWSGSPLDQKNQSAFLAVKTPLLIIAPTEKTEAVLMILQDDRNTLDVGDEVEMRMEAAPGRSLKGTIKSISFKTTDDTPQSLSNKAGGATATRTTSTGEEELMQPTYQAVVTISGSPDLMRADYRGRAQLEVGQRSLGRRLYRWAAYTFNFTL